MAMLQGHCPPTYRVRSIVFFRSRKFVSDIPLDLWLVEESSENANSDDTKTKSDVIIENGHRKLTRNVLKRQDTLTAPASDYILMAKCSKSVIVD